MTTPDSHFSRDDVPARTDGTPGYGLRDFAGDVGEGVKDELLGWVYTGLMWVGMFFAVILPIGGLVVGAVSIFLAVRSGRSFVIPVVMVIASIVVWVVGKSPLGLLPLVLSVF